MPYQCTQCDNVEEKEREVICWKCGKGEMVWMTWHPAYHAPRLPRIGTTKRTRKIKARVYGRDAKSRKNLLTSVGIRLARASKRYVGVQRDALLGLARWLHEQGGPRAGHLIAKQRLAFMAASGVDPNAVCGTAVQEIDAYSPCPGCVTPKWCTRYQRCAKEYEPPLLRGVSDEDMLAAQSQGRSVPAVLDDAVQMSA